MSICLCGAVKFEMEYPAFWAWHDHSRASRVAHGAVYATYVGTWRKRFRITVEEREINRFEEKETGAVRSFCRRCGTPLLPYPDIDARHVALGGMQQIVAGYAFGLNSMIHGRSQEQIIASFGQSTATPATA